MIVSEYMALEDLSLWAAIPTSGLTDSDNSPGDGVRLIDIDNDYQG